MKTYSLGIETVPVALAGDLLIGSVHDGRNYRIMLARINGEEITEIRFLVGENDWEGHSALTLNDGYLIGGAVEGKATTNGGEGWKAYVARLDESLNVLWERKLNIRNNGAVYSILPAGDGFFIAGETGRPGDKGFFLGKVAPEGELLWLKDFGSWNDAVFTTLLYFKSGLKLIGSVKDGRWEVIAFDFDSEGSLLGQEALAEGIALTAALWDGRLILAGYSGEDLWVRGEGWDVTLPNGVATSLLPLEDDILVGGEVEGTAAVMKLTPSGEVPWKKPLWERGWVEVLRGNLALGVKEEDGKTVMAVERFGGF